MTSSTDIPQKAPRPPARPPSGPSDDRPQFVFAGGGTGGHLFPAIAVVEHLRRHGLAVDVSFLCTTKPIDARTLDTWNIAHRTQSVLPLRMRPWSLPGFYLAWRRSLRQCLAQFRERRPAAVIGTGGYGSGPAVAAAARMNIPCAMLNPDALPGRANRHLARRVDEIYLQWADSRRYLRGARAVHVTGCPVRAAFFEAVQHPHANFDLNPNRRTLLVTGASLGAHTINEAMRTLARDLADYPDWQVLHICGDRDEHTLRRAYAESGTQAVVRTFIQDMPAALQAADLVVARAGAVTLAEITAVGRPAILLPYPFHADQHQRINAEVLGQRGAAVVLEDRIDPEANAAQLRTAVLALMRDDTRRAEMARATRQAAPATAARQVAERLLALARHPATHKNSQAV